VSCSGGKHDDQGRFVDTHDKTIRLWDAETGRELCRFLAHTNVHSVALSPDGRFIVSGGNDNGRADLRLWEVPEDLGQQDRPAAPETTQMRAE
jgi:WD40 repeat protein